MDARSASLAGSGTGALCAVDPAVRVTVGTVLVSACLLAPARTAAGMGLVLAVALATWALAGTPWRHVLRALRLALWLYLPLLALQLLAVPAGGTRGTRAMAVLAGAISLKGAATLLVTISVVSTLDAASLLRALSGLPLPASTRLLLVQIVHQAGMLLGETRRIRQVLALRAAGSAGRHDLRLAAGLPRAWLERVAGRAARTAAAMEVRGYALQPPEPFPRPAAWRRPDLLALALALAALALALALALHARWRP